MQIISLSNLFSVLESGEESVWFFDHMKFTKTEVILDHESPSGIVFVGHKLSSPGGPASLERPYMSFVQMLINSKTLYCNTKEKVFQGPMKVMIPVEDEISGKKGVLLSLESSAYGVPLIYGFSYKGSRIKGIEAPVDEILFEINNSGLYTEHESKLMAIDYLGIDPRDSMVINDPDAVFDISIGVFDQSILSNYKKIIGSEL